MEGAETLCCPATAPKPERSGEDLYEEWAKIPAAVCANLIKNYRKPLTSVILKKFSVPNIKVYFSIVSNSYFMQ